MGNGHDVAFYWLFNYAWGCVMGREWSVDWRPARSSSRFRLDVVFFRRRCWPHPRSSHQQFRRLSLSLVFIVIQWPYRDRGQETFEPVVLSAMVYCYRSARAFFSRLSRSLRRPRGPSPGTSALVSTSGQRNKPIKRPSIQHLSVPFYLDA